MRLLSVITFFLLIVSCASSTPTHDSDINASPLNDPFQGLKQYAVEIRDEQRLIAKSRDLAARRDVTELALEQYRLELFADLPNFDDRVTVRMTATPDKIAKFIATAAQYDYISPKSIPVTAFVVSIDLEDKPLIEVLRVLNAKVAKLATIQVHTTPRRTLRFEYR